MSLFHNSEAGEKFAMRAHGTWATISFVNAAYCVIGMVLIEPICHWPNVIGWYFFGLWLQLSLLVLMGVGATVFHVWGARDHADNLKKLADRDKRIKEFSAKMIRLNEELAQLREKLHVAD